MSRGTAIVVAGLGGFVLAFLVVQVYMRPEWHSDDGGEYEGLGLALSVIGGLFAGLAVMIIAAFTAAVVTYWLAARSKPGDSRPFDRGR